MTHPCADHPCDHCYLCDVVGICCQTVTGGAPAASATARDPDEDLHQAILAERGEARPALGVLIRAEALRNGQQQPLLLPAPQPVPPLPIEHQVKEVFHEQLARTAR